MFLTLGSSRKGSGIIHCTDPLGKCGCDYIGNGCVSIHVTQSFENAWPLTFPTTEATTMSSVVGSIIRWPIHLILMLHNEGHTSEHLIQSQDASFIRDSWRKKRVHLWNEAKMQKLGEGVVFLVHPYEAINFTELGESHLGIIVKKSLYSIPDASCHYLDLPHLSLIPWPIKQLTFENGESLKSTDTNVDTFTCDEEVDELLVQDDSDSSSHRVGQSNDINSSASDDELQNTITQAFALQKEDM